MTIPKELKLVSVEWLDSRGCTSRWEHADDLEPLKPCRCVTVGFILEQTKKYLTLAMTVGEGQVLGRITIPVCAIVKRTQL